jgi:hypothetical protein
MLNSIMKVSVPHLSAYLISLARMRSVLQWNRMTERGIFQEF